MNTDTQSNLNDREVMKALQGGRSEMLAILFERHHVRLYNFLYRLTGDRMTSEDLVQEVFFRILKSCHTFRGKSGFPVWMFTIARNIHIDHLRKKKPSLSLDDMHRQPVSESSAPPDQLETEEDRSLVMQALDRLPTRKRELIILSRFRYLDYRAISRMTNMKVNLIKVTIYRAIRDLKKIYQELKEGVA